MGNPWTGEVDLVVNGERLVAKLTLGALAELEAELASDSLVALVERFETGAFSARDLVALLAAGLRGGGWTGTGADLLGAEIGGGPGAAIRAAGALLTRAFAQP